jgi:hypothetical protein
LSQHSPSGFDQNPVLFNPASDLQRHAAGALREWAPREGIVCLDAALFARIPAAERARAWYAPLAWHRDALAVPAESPRRVLLLHSSLADSFPGAEVRLMAYPLNGSFQRRPEREAVRHRLGLSPGRLAIFCREESSPLMRVMQALENDERITILSTEDTLPLDRHHPGAAQAAALAASDLFLAESSAAAVAESIAHGVPLAAFVRPDGDKNARFLCEAGAAIAAQKPGEMLLAIDALAAGFPGQLQQLRRELDIIRGSSRAISSALSMRGCRSPRRRCG